LTFLRRSTSLNSQLSPFYHPQDSPRATVADKIRRKTSLKILKPEQTYSYFWQFQIKQTENILISGLKINSRQHGQIFEIRKIKNQINQGRAFISYSHSHLDCVNAFFSYFSNIFSNLTDSDVFIH